jgi:hypothetical protein
MKVVYFALALAICLSLVTYAENRAVSSETPPAAAHATLTAH